MATKKASATATAAKSKATPAKAKKPAAPKAAAPAKKLSAISDRFTKTQIINQLAEDTSLSKKDVTAVLDSLSDLIERHIKKRAVGDFTLPGLFKIKTVKKPARKARKGINPFTGQETTFAARPASISVKISPLKKLKDMAN